MNENFSELKKILNSLQCSQESIQKASSEFIKIAIKDTDRMEDLVKLWKFYCLNKSNKLAYIYLANDIIQNSFFQNLKFHEVLLNHINVTFPELYINVNEKIRKEMFRMIDIWTERKIYDVIQMENLKKFLFNTTIPNYDNIENPILESFLKNNKIKVSERTKELAYNLDNYVRCEEKINKISDTQNNQNIHYESNESSELRKLKNNQHKNREGILKNSADLIKKQNQVYFKHIYYLHEVDMLLEKINSFKMINKNFENNYSNNFVEYENIKTNSKIDPTNYNMAIDL